MYYQTLRWAKEEKKPVKKDVIHVPIRLLFNIKMGERGRKIITPFFSFWAGGDGLGGWFFLSLCGTMGKKKG